MCIGKCWKDKTCCGTIDVEIWEILNLFSPSMQGVYTVADSIETIICTFLTKISDNPLWLVIHNGEFSPILLRLFLMTELLFSVSLWNWRVCETHHYKWIFWEKIIERKGNFSLVLEQQTDIQIVIL